MKAALGFSALLILCAAGAVSAQQSPESVTAGTGDGATSGVLSTIDSIASQTGPELTAAIEEFANSLSRIANRAANDPELRDAALRAAGGLVSAAQVMVEDHAEQLQQTLAVIAERVEGLANPVVRPDEELVQ